jgi:hypothetical protein
MRRIDIDDSEVDIDQSRRLLYREDVEVYSPERVRRGAVRWLIQ